MNNVSDNLGNLAKDKLIDFVGKIDKRLEEYWDGEVSAGFGFGQEQKGLVREMLLHAKEHNLRASKRIRSAFVHCAYKLNQKEESSEIWKVAEAVEMIHTALLMHDDFMDRDSVRRGKPTTQAFFAKGDLHYGDSMAVCVGDAVLCLGFERFLESDLPKDQVKKALKQLLRGITNTAFGQAFDTSLAKVKSFTEQMVLDLHQAKTAIYTYENPLVSGAILGDASDEVIEVLKNYSKYGGVAFQLQDDILGMFGNEEKTGKSNNSDLLQAKVTLLIVKTLENGSVEQKDSLLKVWGKEGSEEDIEAAKKAIKESGSYDYSIKKARSLALLAVEEARKLRTMDLNRESVDFLEGIAQYMVEREV